MERAICERTRLLVYTSPSNPLGWVATVEEQQALLDFARRHGLWLLADEVYERLSYTGSVTPSAAMLLRINRMAKRTRAAAARAEGPERSAELA